MNIPPEKKEEIENFLEDFRSCSRPRVEIADYDKNDIFFANSGITMEEVQEILLEKLSWKHYKKGPEPEKNPNFPQGIVYHFVYPWENIEIYIKLKVFYNKLGQMSAICISFHD